MSSDVNRLKSKFAPGPRLDSSGPQNIRKQKKSDFFPLKYVKAAVTKARKEAATRAGADATDQSLYVLVGAGGQR